MRTLCLSAFHWDAEPLDAMFTAEPWRDPGSGSGRPSETRIVESSGDPRFFAELRVPFRVAFVVGRKLFTSAIRAVTSIRSSGPSSRAWHVASARACPARMLSTYVSFSGVGEACWNDPRS